MGSGTSFLPVLRPAQLPGPRGSVRVMLIAISEESGSAVILPGLSTTDCSRSCGSATGTAFLLLLLIPTATPWTMPARCIAAFRASTLCSLLWILLTHTVVIGHFQVLISC